MRRMQELGFRFWRWDYRVLGKSNAGLPSEDSAYEVRAAWDWLAQSILTDPATFLATLAV
jgi:hypothetical protein